jgi:superfamily I DNA/RNA helicase
MSAGASARYEAQRSLLEADEYERLASEARQKANRYELASRTEASVGSRLVALEQLGWRVMADRRWAGSKRANVDFLLVGPGGVAVVDVKAWRALQVANGSIYCDEECRDDQAETLLRLKQRVQEALVPLGMTGQAVWPVLVFAGRDVTAEAQGVHLIGELNIGTWMARRGLRLNDSQVQQVGDLLDAEFPAYDTPGAPPQRPALRRSLVMRRPVDQPQPEALLDIDELSLALLEAQLAGPIESWMTFLHPEQLKLVTATWNGPARVRGPAGTGKTVVSLHRASHLAARSADPILFVTFVKTLPNVLGGLASRLAPDVAGRIEFTGLHALARRILDDIGVDVRVDARRSGTAFARAWAARGKDSVLTSLDSRWSYWKEELDHVIKGRGLVDWQEYAGLTRHGRRTAMRREHREAMWDLYVEYERCLGETRAKDFNDLLIMARDAIRDGAAKLSCGAVIVDEVQDLTLVGLELLHAIAGDGPDRLLIVGDGQQAVYPGGFSLAEAGVNVAGRATVLKVNYRNTAEILEVATLVVAGDSYDDLEGTRVAGERPTDVVRTGRPPLIVKASDQRSLDIALTRQIEETVAGLRVPHGDMAVLVHRLSALEHYLRVLRNASIPTVELTDYDGVSCDQVKVGTFKRAKGLEFKYVLLPGLRDQITEPWSGESNEAFRERSERLRRELFVGMTRARDGLWLGYLT